MFDHRPLAAVLFLSALAGPALAGNLDEAPAPAPAPMAPVAAPAPGSALAFTLRGGVAAQPGYFGSDELVVGPDFALSQGFARFGGRSFGSDDGSVAEGFGLRGSFRYIAERSADDFDELAGLEDVDAALELGLGLGYTAQNFEAFADLRYGVVGHESLVAELGADAVLRPADRLTVSAGPRVFMGSDDYAATYFGITPAEAAASSFAAYEAEGGALSAGVELGMTYEFNDRWGLDGAVRYDRFIGDAADSPIVQQGSEDQVSVRLGVTRRVTFGF